MMSNKYSIKNMIWVVTAATAFIVAAIAVILSKKEDD